MVSENGSFSGGGGGFAPDFLKKLTLAKIANGPGASQNQAYGGAPIQELLKAYQESGGSNMARTGGFDIVPYMNGTFAVNRAGVPGMGASQHNDTPYDIYDAQGNYLGSNAWKDLGTDGVDKVVDGTTKALTAAFIGGGMLGGLGIGPMASSAPGATTAGVTTGGGFVGEGALSGVGAWDGALAASPSWTAAGGMTAGAGASNGSWDVAGTVGQAGGGGGVMPPNPFVGGGGGSSGFNLGNIMKGVTGAGGSGGFDWGSLVGPAMSAGAGIYGASQAGKAADTQAAAAERARADLEPWRVAGGNALTRLQEELGIGGNASAPGYGRAARDFGMADFEADPGYQFRKSEQEKALERAAPLSGGRNSGRYLKDAMRFSGGLASQEYGNAFNRYQTSRTNRLNPFQSLAGVGQSTAGQIADYATQAGNAQAAGRVGQANALTGALGQGWSMYQNNQQQNQNNALMQAILAGRA